MSRHHLPGSAPSHTVFALRNCRRPWDGAVPGLDFILQGNIGVLPTELIRNLPSTFVPLGVSWWLLDSGSASPSSRFDVDIGMEPTFLLLFGLTLLAPLDIPYDGIAI